MPTDNTARRILRLAVISLGSVVLIWLSLEDRDERRAILLAALLSALGAVAAGVRFRRKMRAPWIIVLGAGFGLLVPLVAVSLMVVKTGLHSHSTPDFTLAQVTAVLQLIPIWTGVGCLVGGAAVLFEYIRG